MKECEDEEGLRDAGVVKSLSTLKVRRRILYWMHWRIGSQ